MINESIRQQIAVLETRIAKHYRSIEILLEKGRKIQNTSTPNESIQQQIAVLETRISKHYRSIEIILEKGRKIQNKCTHPEKTEKIYNALWCIVCGKKIDKKYVPPKTKEGKKIIIKSAR